mgnify:FL=1
MPELGWLTSRCARLFVPFAAGGGTDAFARPLAAQLDAPVGQTRADRKPRRRRRHALAHRPRQGRSDGYTFFMGAAHHAIAPSLYPNLDYNIEKDFIAVALIARPPQVVVVNPGQGLCQDAGRVHRLRQSQPGQTELRLRRRRHHASSRGRVVQDPDQDQHPARPLPRGRTCDAGSHRRPRAGRIRQARFVGAAPVRAGQLRALAVAAPKRVPAFPDLPTRRRRQAAARL